MTAKNAKPKMITDDNIGIHDNDVAMLLDLNCATVYCKLKGWVLHNQNNGKNLRDGRYWTFNSMRAWSLELPFLSESQIRYALEKLESAGLIVTGSYNSQPYDRTKWYSVNPVPRTNKPIKTEDSTPENPQSHLINLSNGEDKILEPIPMINTNSNTMIKDDEEEERNENFNSSIQKQNQETAKVFKSYESEIGVLTSLIGNEIKAFLEQDNVSPDWIIAAIEEASRNNKRSWSYISAIIKRWQVEGFQSSNKPEAKPSGKVQTKSKPPYKKPKYDMGDYEVSHESEVLYDFGDKDFIKGDDREIPF